MSDFRKLAVWQKAHEMSLAVSRVAQDIPRARHKALRDQLTRAADSVPTNIVEGRAQSTDAQFARFLDYSIASASETEYHLISARDKGVIRLEDYQSLCEQVIEVRKMLHGLVNKLRQQ
jgi:four helix bundle protein